MPMALDSNVLSALWSTEPSAARVWQELRDSRARTGLVICAPVYAELCAHPTASREWVDNFLVETSIAIDFSLDEMVWRKTADAFGAYAERRRRSGAQTPKRLLADFLIASHALLRADGLFTLDQSRYQSAFPQLRLI